MVSLNRPGAFVDRSSEPGRESSRPRNETLDPAGPDCTSPSLTNAPVPSPDDSPLLNVAVASGPFSIRAPSARRNLPRVETSRSSIRSVTPRRVGLPTTWTGVVAVNDPWASPVTSNVFADVPSWNPPPATASVTGATARHSPDVSPTLTSTPNPPGPTDSTLEPETVPDTAHSPWSRTSASAAAMSVGFCIVPPRASRREPVTASTVVPSTSTGT